MEDSGEDVNLALSTMATLPNPMVQHYHLCMLTVTTIMSMTRKDAATFCMTQV